MSDLTENQIKFSDYTEADFETLSWNEHIRRRSGMYIGKLGDGSSPDDGLYVLFKEIVDNAIDEFIMGYGKSVKITLGDDNMVTVRDYGRGIPLGKLVDAVSKMNTGAKYGSNAFSKSVGLNGVGTKAVNATSSYFYIQSFRDGESAWAQFSQGNLVDSGTCTTTEKNGTLVKYIADPELYGNYKYNFEFIETMLKNYSYLNTGLSLNFNGIKPVLISATPTINTNINTNKEARIEFGIFNPPFLTSYGTSNPLQKYLNSKSFKTTTKTTTFATYKF